MIEKGVFLILILNKKVSLLYSIQIKFKQLILHT